MRMRKKGDLNLSINAIVVLILAITMLGLGLGFMRNMFSKTTSQFSEVGDTMKDQIISDIQSSNERLAFNKNEITMKKGETKDVFFGIKNDLETTTDFGIAVACDDTLLDDAQDQAALDGLAFKTFDKKKIEVSEVAVMKMQVISKSNAIQTTYSCTMQVAYSGGLYKAKQFYVSIE